MLVLVGVLAALYIRKVQRPKRFEGSHLGEADLILAMIATIVISLLLWHATRIALGLNEWPASWSPVSNALSHLFADNQTTRVLERVFVWVHVLTILAFLAYLPRSKHLHIVVAAINVWFGRTGAGGRLEPLQFDDPDVPEEDLRFGAGQPQDLTWKQVLDTFSCTECGRCQDACPAFATGKVLSPKLVIMGLRDAVFAEGEDAERPLVPTRCRPRAVWDCVTCGACVQACPVSIEHVDHIVDLRRHLVMVESSFPTEAEPMLRDVERASNPWGKPQSERADWAAELGVKCSSRATRRPSTSTGWAAPPRSTSGRVAPPRPRHACLTKAGVDFAILGPRESCTGDPARRIGNEYVFQAFAEQNVETLNEAGVTKIVTSCPHCFNTLANEYPDFGGKLRGDPPLRAAGAARPRRPAEPKRADQTTARSPTTTPATWPATTTCSTRRASSSPPSAPRSRWSARASRRSAAAPAARTCGWRSAPSRSTRSACARPPPPAPTRSPSPARSAR